MCLKFLKTYFLHCLNIYLTATLPTGKLLTVFSTSTSTEFTIKWYIKNPEVNNKPDMKMVTSIVKNVCFFIVVKFTQNSLTKDRASIPQWVILRKRKTDNAAPVRYYWSIKALRVYFKFSHYHSPFYSVVRRQRGEGNLSIKRKI